MNKRERVIWIVVVVLLLMAIGYGIWRNNKVSNQYISSLRTSDSLRTYIDKNGNLHSIKQVTQISKDEYENSQDSFISDVRKNTKAKDLVQHTKATITTKDSLRAPIHDTFYVYGGDTTAIQAFAYEDEWLELDGIIQKEPKEVAINYSINNPLTITHKWQKEKWYHKKDLVVDIKTMNPHTTTGNVQTIVIQQPPKKFYETKAFAFGLGAIAGFFISKN